MRSLAAAVRLAAFGLTAALAMTWAPHLLAAETVVILKDGQRIRATEATIHGDVVEMRLATGDLLSYPAASVATIELEGNAAAATGQKMAPSRARNAAAPASGPALSFPGPPDEELEPTSAQTEAPTMAPPLIAWRPAVVGSPYQPRAPIIDPTWQPTNGFPAWAQPSPTPVRFTPPIVDPTWIPTSVFDRSVDVLTGGRAQWSTPIIDSTWQPTDAFSK